MRRECRERFPRYRLQRKLLVSDPGMHHGTCVTRVTCYMPGSPTGSGGENVPGIPGACATRNIMYLARGPYSAITWSLSWLETMHRKRTIFRQRKNMVGWMILETARTFSDSNWASPLMSAVKKRFPTEHSATGIRRDSWIVKQRHWVLTDTITSHKNCLVAQISGIGVCRPVGVILVSTDASYATADVCRMSSYLRRLNPYLGNTVCQLVAKLFPSTFPSHIITT